MTAQVHEQLILDGVVTSMAFCPRIPEDHPDIRKLSDTEIHNGLAGNVSSIIFSTACWREYIGTWMVRDNRFYLVDIVGRYQVTTDIPIFADWVKAVLHIPKGELLQYVHMGFGSVYEFEHHIEIKDGQVINQYVLDNRHRDLSGLW
jgi:hypothetical protein